MHVISGDLPVIADLPRTLGHENAGTVAAAGAGVRTVKEGDAVAVYGGFGDGVCDYCVMGEENLCPAGQWVGLSIHDGGYAELMLVPHERYLKELREVMAMADDGGLTSFPLAFEPLERINDVYRRVEQGRVEGRAVITP